MSELNDKGVELFELYIERYKAKMKKIAEECLGDIYINLSSHIESDAWTNYRGELRSEMTREIREEITKWTREQYWAFEVRALILKEHKAELADAINKDLELKIERLEADNDELRHELSAARWR